MSTPAYHLRTNKAVDRLLFLETIKRLVRYAEIGKYKYYGFGGPYLDDFRLLHENFPDMELTSIERDENVLKRQRFHLPNSKIKLINKEMGDFIANESFDDSKCIFWLDYTQLRYSQYSEFRAVLERVASGSIIKITLLANSKYYGKKDKQEEFKKYFGDILPISSMPIPENPKEFCFLLQKMLKIVAERALPSYASSRYFQPLTSFFYKDGQTMFTFTGVVIEKEEKDEIKNKYNTWIHANLEWSEPVQISLPFLSIKERLWLEEILPCSPKNLCERLGYKIESKNNEEQIKQYCDFYREYPYFIKGFL